MSAQEVATLINSIAKLAEGLQGNQGKKLDKLSSDTLQKVHVQSINEFRTFESVPAAKALTLIDWLEDLELLLRVVVGPDPFTSQPAFCAGVIRGKLRGLARRHIDAKIKATPALQDQPAQLIEALQARFLTDQVRAAAAVEFTQLRQGKTESWESYMTRAAKLARVSGTTADESVIQRLVHASNATCKPGVLNWLRTMRLIGKPPTFDGLRQEGTLLENAEKGLNLNLGLGGGGGASTSGGAVPMDIDIDALRAELEEDPELANLDLTDAQVAAIMTRARGGGGGAAAWANKGQSKPWQQRPSSAPQQQPAQQQQQQQQQSGKPSRHPDDPPGFISPYEHGLWPTNLSTSREQLWERHRQGQCYLCEKPTKNLDHKRWVKCPELAKLKAKQGKV